MNSVAGHQHASVTREDCVNTAQRAGTPLAALATGLDRSIFVFLPDSPAAGLDGPSDEVHLLGEGSQYALPGRKCPKSGSSITCSAIA